MATVVTDPETGQSYALYVDPRTGESASTPISAEQAASAKAGTSVDEYGSAARTIDFNPYTAQVVTDRPAIADVPKELASNSIFQDVNANTAGGLARAYGDIKAGNAQVFQGDNNIPMVYLGGTNQAYELIPSGTPGQYSIYVGAGQVGRGDGYKVPITVDAKGNVQMPEQAITGGGIQYVGSGGGGWDFGEVLSDFGNTLKDAAPYLAAGYLGTQYLPGLLGGEAAGLGYAGDATAVGYDPLFGTSAGAGVGAGAGLDALAADNIDIGGGYNPATGMGDPTTAAAAAATGVTSSAGIPYGASGMGATLTGLAPAAGLAGAAGAAGAGAGLSNLAKAALVGSALSKVLTPTQKQTANPNAPDQTPVGGELSPAYQPYRYKPYAAGGEVGGLSAAAQRYNLGGYSDGGRLLKGPGDGVSDSIPATIGAKKQPARLADGEFVVPARIVSELGNGSTEAGARKLYAMMDRIQAARKKSVGKGKVAVNSRADKYLPK